MVAVQARHLSSSAGLQGDPRQTSVEPEHVGSAEDVSSTDYQHCMNSAVRWGLLLPKLIFKYVFEGTA